MGDASSHPAPSCLPGTASQADLYKSGGPSLLLNSVHSPEEPLPKQDTAGGFWVQAKVKTHSLLCCSNRTQGWEHPVYTVRGDKSSGVKAYDLLLRGENRSYWKTKSEQNGFHTVKKNVDSCKLICKCNAVPMRTPTGYLSGIG